VTELVRVLELVNKARVALGKPILAEIPVGQKASSSQCPLARALDGGTVRVGGYFARFQTDEEALLVSAAWDSVGEAFRGEVFLPVALKVFVRAFDRGELPQFVEKE
jgi:hypothetical protein